MPETLLGPVCLVLFTWGWPPLTGGVRSENTEASGSKPEPDGTRPANAYQAENLPCRVLRHPVGRALLLVPSFYSLENCGTERSSNFPKVTQLISRETGIAIK